MAQRWHIPTEQCPNDQFVSTANDCVVLSHWVLKWVIMQQDKQDRYEPLPPPPHPVSAQFHQHNDLCAQSKSSESCLRLRRICNGQASAWIWKTAKSPLILWPFWIQEPELFLERYSVLIRIRIGLWGSSLRKDARRQQEGQRMSWDQIGAGNALTWGGSWVFPPGIFFLLSSVFLWAEIPMGHLWIIFGENS